MIKVTKYIERRGLKIIKKNFLTKFNYCEIQLPSSKENFKKVNNFFYLLFLSNFDLEMVILFLVQF